MVSRWTAPECRHSPLDTSNASFSTHTDHEQLEISCIDPLVPRSTCSHSPYCPVHASSVGTRTSVVPPAPAFVTASSGQSLPIASLSTLPEARRTASVTPVVLPPIPSLAPPVTNAYCNPYLPAGGLPSPNNTRNRPRRKRRRNNLSFALPTQDTSIAYAGAPHENKLKRNQMHVDSGRLVKRARTGASLPPDGPAVHKQSVQLQTAQTSANTVAGFGQLDVNVNERKEFANVSTTGGTGGAGGAGGIIGGNGGIGMGPVGNMALESGVQASCGGIVVMHRNFSDPRVPSGIDCEFQQLFMSFQWINFLDSPVRKLPCRSVEKISV
ncbi:hypothetical protein B0H12DRAFT_1074123 [Mycena haematopus]|nr:hypothetical protein B0H12DRAFT_1074123 [Mycena haematopus]